MPERAILIAVGVGVVCLLVGIGIGFGIGKGKYDNGDDDVATPTSNDMKPSTPSAMKMQEERIEMHRNLTGMMKNENIRDNLKYLTELPHEPGKQRNENLGEEIKKRWEADGLDRVDKFKYNIYLPFPKSPSKIIALKPADGSEDKTIAIESAPFVPGTEKSGAKVVPPFNAFGANGEVTAPVVYCNYGLDGDFDQLEKLNISVKGKILLFRYGKTARSNKAYRTELRGGLGAIIFSDPQQYVFENNQYPNGYTGSADGVQRGTVNRINGDSLSIGYPSKDGYYRLTEAKYKKDVNNVKIPVQPISENHAKALFDLFLDDSIKVPDAFKGDLSKYVLQSGRNFTLKTDIEFKTLPSYTYCGTIFGKTEQDRYVMVGNHRDAWTFGAADPSSGTAVIMEMGRVLGEMRKKHGWRPERSIKICSWGAEEPGILGSYEWADEHKDFLMNNVVLYVNVDMAVEGNFTIRLRSLDYYAKMVKDAAKLIPSANDEKITLYEDWRQSSAKLAKKTLKEMKEPTHSMLSSGSDYKALWHNYGVASGDFRYYFSRLDFARLSQNSNYHTRYDSFDWMSKFVDPEFKYHQTIGRLMLGATLMAADKVIVPLYVVDYVKQIMVYFKKFEDGYKDILTKKSISLDFARSRLDLLLKKAEQFQVYVDNLKEEQLSNAYMVRQINDKIIHFEKHFLIDNIIKRDGVRHVIWASNFYKLKNTKFPGLNEAMYFASQEPGNDWDDVRKQLTYVIWCVDSANMALTIDEA